MHRKFPKTLAANSEQDLELLFHQLLQIIIKKIKKSSVQKTKNKRKRIIMNKAFHLLEVLIKNRALPFQKMEDEMLVFYEILENPNKIRLEKEIFTILVQMIEIQHVISPAIEKIFHILPNCLRINNFNISVIFHLINYMLYLGKGFVQNNIKILEEVVEIAAYCILGNEENEGEVNQALAALILQSVILV